MRQGDPREILLIRHECNSNRFGADRSAASSRAQFSGESRRRTRQWLDMNPSELVAILGARGSASGPPPASPPVQIAVDTIELDIRTTGTRGSPSHPSDRLCAGRGWRHARRYGGHVQRHGI